MNIKIQSVRFDADKKLLDFVEAKAAKLERFSDKIISIDVTLRIDKDLEKGNKEAVILVHVPNDSLVSERKSESFEESTDLCIDALKKQLDKYKTKA